MLEQRELGFAFRAVVAQPASLAVLKVNAATIGRDEFAAFYRLQVSEEQTTAILHAIRTIRM